MRGATERVEKDLIGLFELDQSGTVLYRRPVKPEACLDFTDPQVTGKDFFNDVAAIENADDLKRHFKRFVSSDRSVDNFIFDCLCSNETVKTRVSMTRASESDPDHSAGIIILEIKKASA
jgi:hypothetical protein